TVVDRRIRPPLPPAQRRQRPLHRRAHDGHPHRHRDPRRLPADAFRRRPPRGAHPRARRMTGPETEAFLHAKIPLARAMGVRVERCDSEGLVLTAPLEPNHNHLGTAFGGSLAALATLAGYA